MTAHNDPHPTERFSDYVDGEMSPLQEEAFQRHLSQCPSCRQDFADFKTSVDLLRGLGESPAPPDFARTVTTSIHHQSKGRFFREWWLFGLRIPQEAVVAVIFLIGLAALFLFTQHQRGYAVISDAPDAQVANKETMKPSDNQAALGTPAEIWLVTVSNRNTFRQLRAQLRAQALTVRTDGTSPHGAILIDVPAGRFPEVVPHLRAVGISDVRFDDDPTYPLTLRIELAPDEQPPLGRTL